VSDVQDKSREQPVPDPSNDTSASMEFAAEVGRLVRRGRARRGITRRQLAGESGISERYLAQIEGGYGNPSMTVLKAIADALESPFTDLVPGSEGSEKLNRLVDLIKRLAPSEWPALEDVIEARIVKSAKSQRAHRIALVGLRGAGKSTLGRMLAERLNYPFVELNRVVEQEYGASISMLIELSGVSTFRRYERASLEKVIADHDKVVIATAGGIVSSPDTYALLLRCAHTVWIKARPQEHMERVLAQGDFRPMSENREAMADLVAILDARSADYAQAEAALDTAGQSVDASADRLFGLVQEWTA
jgi:XRE family transcriptional regulator, aerobic/anaerobic benzoate catabolism transcriptional regulator